MKKKYFLGMILAAMTALTACDEAMETNLPEDYAAVVYLQEYGVVNIEMTEADADKIYRMTVLKGGNTPQSTTNAEFRIMTAEELALYSDDYVAFPENCYLVGEGVEFKSGDKFRQCEVVLKSSEMVKFIKQHTDKVCVLPIQMESRRGVSGTRGHLILQPELIEPKISMIANQLQEDIIYLKDPNDTQAVFYFDFSLGLEDNSWNFNCVFEENRTVLKQYVAEYNSANGTEYELLPDGTYSLEPIKFSEGSIYVPYELIVESNKFKEAGTYILPVALKEASMPFDVDKVPRFIKLEISNGLPKIELTTSMMYTNNGGSISNCIDGNQSTFWESTWNSNDYQKWLSDKNNGIENSMWDATYGVYIDVTLEKSYQSLQFKYQIRHNNNNTVPTEIQLFGSSDNGVTWNSISEKFTYSENALPTKQLDWYESKTFDSTSSYSKLRFAVTKQRDFKNSSNTDKSLTNPTSAYSVSLNEFELYGLETTN